MSLKKFLKAFGKADKPSVQHIKNLWDDPAYKYAIHQIVEDLKNQWLASKDAAEREAAHQQYRAVQALTFKMQHLYNTSDR